MCTFQITPTSSTGHFNLNCSVLLNEGKANHLFCLKFCSLLHYPSLCVIQQKLQIPTHQIVAALKPILRKEYFLYH
jgi:hypothetical protein